MIVPFDQQPDDARLWIFAADRPLGREEETALLSAVDDFLEDWTAHRADLKASRDWREGRFLFVAVDESQAAASGCSIDALMRFLKEAGQRFNADLIDHGQVLYRGDDEIVRVSRDDFTRLAAAGSVDSDTVVFNNTLTSVGQLKEGQWEVPAGESWHGPAFFE